MPAPKGHPKWGNPLNTKKYTPIELWDGACDYFNWCNDNPWEKEVWVGKEGIKDKEILQRPYSIWGLCTHLNISMQTFFNYEKAKGYETYFDICARIKAIIDSQHFEGGMVGAFNANIVNRKLGLIEKTESQNNINLNEGLTLKIGDTEIKL